MLARELCLERSTLVKLHHKLQAHLARGSVLNVDNARICSLLPPVAPLRFRAPTTRESYGKLPRNLSLTKPSRLTNANSQHARPHHIPTPAVQSGAAATGYGE